MTENFNIPQHTCQQSKDFFFNILFVFILFASSNTTYEQKKLAYEEETNRSEQ